MEIKYQKVNYQDYNLTFTINREQLVGVTGKGKTDFLKILSSLYLGSGVMKYDEKKLTKKTRGEIFSKCSYVPKDFSYISFLSTVEDYMYYEIKKYQLKIKDPERKIRDSLKIVGMKEEYLKKEVRLLSISEKKLVQLAIALLSNPELILLDEPFLSFDMKTEKKILMLFSKLKENYKRSIVIASDDSNMLYRNTEEMIFLKGGKVLLEGATKEVYQRVDFLKRNSLEIPDSVLFVYKAKRKKQVHIDYQRDIRDLIKDIYKHI